jgi:hypothetical protein
MELELIILKFMLMLPIKYLKQQKAIIKLPIIYLFVAMILILFIPIIMLFIQKIKLPLKPVQTILLQWQKPIVFK